MDMSQTLYHEGRALMEAGNLEQAVQRLKQSVEVAPHFKPLELLGECLLKLRRRLETIVPLAAATAWNNQMGQLAKRQVVDFPVSDGPPAFRPARLSGRYAS